MMTNLFSIFDPSSSIMSFQSNWTSMMMGAFLMPYFYWLLPSRTNMMMPLIITTLHKEFNLLVKSMGKTLLFISLFIFILMNNMMGLIPFVFTATSHLLITLSLSIPLWTSLMLYGWVTKMNHMMIHLVPQGTPGPLMSFMVCIETISNMIRPGTLAVRLAANMIAGHLLLTLLGNQSPNSSYMILPSISISQILLLLLETAVAMIQAYVFTILIVLYTSEVQ